MKTLSKIVLLLLIVTMNSCTSEYEERLIEAKSIQTRLLNVEKSLFNSPNQNLVEEIEKLESEINFLAKTSGNEETFLAELHETD